MASIIFATFSLSFLIKSSLCEYDMIVISIQIYLVLSIIYLIEIWVFPNIATVQILRRSIFRTLQSFGYSFVMICD